MDGTVPWLLWSLLEMGPQECPVPSMAGASSDGTWCNGVTTFTDCRFLTLDPLSQRIQAVNSSPVSPVCWLESADDEEDWPDEWWHDSESDWMEDWQDDWYWHDSEDCASEWNDNESAYLVCGVAGQSAL